ncbi:hypothetical protein [[Flexibacter] sp. ATCC 35208]|uniref:hypothetical protein n=1 Tax=[Flexibacter] sp. ATCC 35208 TaxID=1936242 RepID=UPI0009CA53B5|nr:hypothetical protein [[Flexibacter] sp. ATCC 35208]OMP80045.1 hypothetical protein BW716_06010 [[Flexibacter] sp. ATCC 35208]
MKIVLNEIGDHNMMQVFIRGKVFNIDHHTGDIEPQDKSCLPVNATELNYRDGKFYAIYDESEKALYRDGEIKDYLNQHRISIPKSILLGPISDNEMLNDINRKCFECEANLVVVNETIRNRILGILPVVDIMGDKFHLDMCADMLRLVKDDTYSIALKDFSNDGEFTYAWYDKPTKSLAKFDYHTIVDTPKDVYLIRLNSWFAVDPIGYAMKEIADGKLKNNNVTEYINVTMMDTNPTAVSTPVARTSLADVIFNNRIQKKLPPENGRKMITEVPKKHI